MDACRHSLCHCNKFYEMEGTENCIDIYNAELFLLDSP
jgi:hypothetical protein